MEKLSKEDFLKLDEKQQKEELKRVMMITKQLENECKKLSKEHNKLLKEKLCLEKLINDRK